VANQASATVSVLLGNGAGSFGAKTDFTTANGPRGVAVRDLSGDGKFDLAVACLNASKVSVLLGNGTGGFGAKTDFATGAQPVAVAVGDWNGDGKPDLAAANQGANTVSILTGTGTGSFGASTDLPVTYGPGSIAPMDLNGDGTLDLAVACAPAGQISVLRGIGGAITPPGVKGFTSGASQGYSIVATPGFLIGTVRVDGVSQGAISSYSFSNVTANHSIDVSLNSGFTITASAGTGGSITPPGVITLPTGGGQAYTIAASAGSRLRRSRGWCLARRHRLVFVHQRHGEPLIYATFDGYSIIANAGSGKFGPRTALGTGMGPVDVAVGDLNGDHKPDLVIANSQDYSLSVLLGDGAGGFGALTTFATSFPPAGLATADLSGDGLLDIAVAEPQYNMVSVLLADGAGGFGPPMDHAVGPGPTAVAIGDLNEDGYPDLVVANTGGSSMSLLLGTGAGNFANGTQFSGGTQPSSIAIGDLDSDSHLDVIAGSPQASQVTVLRGDGAGGFEPQVESNTGVNCAALAIGDLNHDGYIDVVVASSYTSKVSVLSGDGTGQFEPIGQFDTGYPPSSVAVGDLNGDGKLDVAAPNIYALVVSVLLGDGSGALGSRTDFGAGVAPGVVTIADVSADGLPDLAVVNADNNTNTVSVLLGVGGSIAPPGRTVLGSGASQAYTITAHQGYVTTDVLVDGVSQGAIGSYTFAGVTSNHSIDASFTSGFTLTANAGVGGSITPAGVITVASGATQPYAIAAANGYIISDVLVDGISQGAVGSYTFSNVVSNHTVAASFVPAYRITAAGGSGVFGPKTDYGPGSFPTSDVLRDVSGDGNPDLIVANWFGNSVSVLLGDGAGGFGPKTDFGAGDRPVSVAVGDLNGDGKPDLAVANYGTPAVSVLLGSGTGSFATKLDFPVGGNPTAIAIGDLDVDGKPDLAVTSAGSNSVAVLRGRRWGWFWRQRRIRNRNVALLGRHRRREPGRQVRSRGNEPRVQYGVDPARRRSGWVRSQDRFRDRSGAVDRCTRRSQRRRQNSTSWFRTATAIRFRFCSGTAAGDSPRRSIIPPKTGPLAGRRGFQR
jgi:hypothetical protein